MTTPANLTIRPARREEAAILAELVDYASEGLAPYFWEQAAEEGQNAFDVGIARIERDDTSFSYRKMWVADLSGTPRGCLLAYRQPDEAEPIEPDITPLFRPLLELENEATGTGYINVLSTVPEARGTGVGSALLAFAERYRGPKGMSLIVADNNVRARALYERQGFRNTASRPMIKDAWETDGTEWILMVKP